jgi:uncharacterized membrane protein YuzA (DUF378 family)
MLHKVTFILLVIGGLNWLLFVLGWEVGASFLPGGMSGAFAKTVYVLVGLSAIYEIAMHKSNCKQCAGGGSAMPS